MRKLILAVPLLAATAVGQQFVPSDSVRFPKLSGTTVDAVLDDFDGDGALDVFLVTLTGSRLLVNDGIGSFRDVSARLAKVPISALAVASGDIDGDRDLDLVVGYQNRPTRLYRNRLRQDHVLPGGGLPERRSARPASRTPVRT